MAAHPGNYGYHLIYWFGSKELSLTFLGTSMGLLLPLDETNTLMKFPGTLSSNLTATVVTPARTTSKHLI
jgi:hypothetical protein